LLAAAYVDPAERLPATDAAAVLTASIGYDRVHGCRRCRTARALNQRHSADFDFVHFLFPAYVYMFAFFRPSCQPLSLTLKL
jgi:hypothetical protein